MNAEGVAAPIKSRPEPASTSWRAAAERGGWSDLAYYLSVPRTWLQLTAHNTWGILNVLDFIWLRPLPGGLINLNHPFCTGLNPRTGHPIWTDNIVFRSPPKTAWRGGLRPESDEQIVLRVGDYLRHQVCLAAATPEHPSGRPSRMPPGILYLHGGVHYHGGWLIFNDFPDAIRHFTDPRFLAEFKRFVREEKREPITLFRERDYDRRQFAHFVCFMRTILPWFSNSNGPKKWVLWGNPAPYPAVNTITGHWIRDCRALKSEATRHTVARPPLAPNRYFQAGPYFGRRDAVRWPERLLARLTEKRIRLRGQRENLYFVDKRKLQSGFRFGPEPIPTPIQKLRGRFTAWIARCAPGKTSALPPLALLAVWLATEPACAWGPHPTITQSALDTLEPNHPLRAQLGPALESLTNLCWLPDHKRTPFPDDGSFFYADDYLLFPGTVKHLDHICPEVQLAYRPYLRRALQALRTETPVNASRWIGSLLHFTEDTGSPPHAAQIRGGTHLKMENWVDATRIRIPGYRPQLLGTNDADAANGFVKRMEGLIAFSRPRGQRLATPVLIGNRDAVQPIVLECALATPRVVADLLHTLGHLARVPTASDATLEGVLRGRPPPELQPLPAKIMIAGTAFSTLSDAAGRFVLRQLPAGRHQLWIVRPGGEPVRRELDLEPGSVARLEVPAADGSVNFLRNGSFNVRWIQPGQPDFWYRTDDGWEGEIVPVTPGQRYRVEARFRPGAEASVLVRWSRRIPAEVPRVSPLPKIQSRPLTPADPVLEFTGTESMGLMHVTLKSRLARDPSSVCDFIRLTPVPGS